MNNYRERRYKTGLNVRTFAKIIGSNPYSVYYWERGKTHPRNPETEKNIDYLVDLIEKLKKNTNLSLLFSLILFITVPLSL